MSKRKSHRTDAANGHGEQGRGRRVALVTGGAVRLGRAIALGLAEAGHDVAIGYHSSGDDAERARLDIEGLGRSCLAVRADLAEPDGPEALVDAVRERYGRLDVVVNSAASFRSGALADVDAREWDAVMDLNVRAPHLVVRAAAAMLDAAEGCVVNIADLSAFQAWAQYPHHSVSKAALAHLTRVQARALAPRVRVNAVAPGAVLAPDEWPESRWQTLARRAVLRRTGSPDDVVRAVLYLVEADFVTGHVLPVDGGRLLGQSGPDTDDG